MQKTISGVNAWMVNLYGKTLKQCFRIPKDPLADRLALHGQHTVYLFTKLPVNLIPPEDRGFLFAFVNLPSGMAAKKRMQQQTEA